MYTNATDFSGGLNLLSINECLDVSPSVRMCMQPTEWALKNWTILKVYLMYLMTVTQKCAGRPTYQNVQHIIWSKIDAVNSITVKYSLH